MSIKCNVNWKPGTTDDQIRSIGGFIKMIIEDIETVEQNGEFPEFIESITISKD